MTEQLENTSKKPERDELGRLLPGQPSLNPAGKPKGSKHITTLLMEALKSRKNENGKSYEELFIERILTETIIKGKGDMVKHAWDHIDGTPSQAIDLTSGGDKLEAGADVMAMAAEISERLRKQKTDCD